MESSSRPAPPDMAADPQDPPQAASLAQPPSGAEQPHPTLCPVASVSAYAYVIFIMEQNDEDCIIF